MCIRDSLYEKGQVLLADGQYDALREVETEALRVAEELRNPDVMFGARLLSARSQVAYAPGNYDSARKTLERVLTVDTLTEEQRAEAYLTIYEISGKADEEARTRALALYESLYRNTPKFIYNYHLATLGEEGGTD